MVTDIPPQELRIVIVDRDPATAERIRSVLERELPRQIESDDPQTRIDIFLAPTPCQGCRAVSEWNPTLFFVDTLSRCATGQDLLRRIREGNRDVGIVLTAPDLDPDTTLEAAWRGASAVLSRPFTDGQLLQAACRALEFYRGRRLERDSRYAFALTLGHELKSPLDAVEMILNNLVSGLLGTLNEEQFDSIRRALTRLQTMRSLITDFLDWSRLGAERRRRNMEIFSAEEIVRKVIDQASEAARTAGVVILSDVPHSIRLRADRWEIEILLSNLVSNAIKYNRPGGRVIIRGQENEDAIFFEVEDTGIGIDPAALSRLFKPFSRLRDPRAEGVSGSGLGLAIAREIALLYDGDIEVRSVPEVGSCFTARLRRCRGIDLPSTELPCPFET